MLQHVVLFKFPTELSADESAEMRDLVLSWVDEIPETKAIRLGPPLYEERAEGYHYLLYLEVDDLEALQRYLSHPAHLRFGKWASDRGCTFLIFNYLVDERTAILP
jgi:Stress responsive A/B Barrel Domain